MIAQDETHFQNTSTACPFKYHFEVSPPSCTKYFDSISSRLQTFKNSAWFPSSVKSLGLGVAVQHSLYGAWLNTDMIFDFILPSKFFKMLDSSKIIEPYLCNSKLSSCS